MIGTKRTSVRLFTSHPHRYETSLGRGADARGRGYRPKPREALRYQGEPQQWHPPTSISTRRITQALPLVSTHPRRRGVLSSHFLSYQAKITSQPPPSIIHFPTHYIPSVSCDEDHHKMSSPDYVNSKRLQSLYEECSLHHTFNQSKSSLSDSESSGRLDVRR